MFSWVLFLQDRPFLTGVAFFDHVHVLRSVWGYSAVQGGEVLW